MKKNTLKYLIDALLFIDICSIAVIGLFMAFIVPAGPSGRSAKYFLGLHRHDWGDIHLFLSVLLLVLLFLHLGLNWTWIAQSTKRYFGKNWKHALWGISGAWFIVIIVAWVFRKVLKLPR